MTIGELRDKYLEVYSDPTRSRNKIYLRKKIAWQIQALAEGGLSQRALDRIEELAPLAPIRWRPNLKDVVAVRQSITGLHAQAVGLVHVADH